MDDLNLLQNKSRETKLSFWDAIHDANLDQVVSHAMARTVALVFKIDHLIEFAGLPSEIRWRLVLDNASVLQARQREVWPGPAPKLNGLSSEKQSELVAAYQSKGRKVSVDWHEFEHKVFAHKIWMKDLTLHLRDADVVLYGYGHDNIEDTLYEIRLIGGQCRCERSDGEKTSLEALLRLGTDYWDAFSKSKG